MTEFSTDEKPTAGGAAGSNNVQGKGLILIMDDEESILHVLRAMIRELGYEAITARDARSAIKSFERHTKAGRTFAAVILDLTIPGGPGGQEVVEEIHRIDPTMPAVVSSGYSTNPVMSNPKAFGFSAVLPKPYILDEVSRILDEVLGSNHSG